MLSVSWIITTSGFRHAMLNSRCSDCLSCSAMIGMCSPWAETLVSGFRFGIAFLCCLWAELLLLPVFVPPCWIRDVPIHHVFPIRNAGHVTTIASSRRHQLKAEGQFCRSVLNNCSNACRFGDIIVDTWKWLLKYRRRVLDDVVSGRSRSLPWSGNKVQTSFWADHWSYWTSSTTPYVLH